MKKARGKARPSPAPRKRAQALAVRYRSTVTKARVEVLPPEGELQRIAPEAGMNLGAFGLVELKLTKAEEVILSEAIDPRKILWRPREKDGPPVIPYYPHQEYTRWFNRAFGRTGWSLVPIAKPGIARSEKNPAQQTITQPYILHVHGKPIAFAQGEQEYFEGNKQQTYGDALESTHASALRRCAKHLGIGLELWDKDYIHSLRPSAPDSYRAPEPRTYRAPEDNQAPASHHQQSGQKITEKQQKRLWVIIRNSGRDEITVRDWIARRFGLTSSKDITRDKYEFICSAIESPAELPEVNRGQ